MTLDKNFKRQFPGKIVLFKQKKAGTEYYDSLPLVLGIRLIGSKMFGVNLNLIPMRDKNKFIKVLIGSMTKDMKLQINKILQGSVAKLACGAFEIYEAKDIKGTVQVIPKFEDCVKLMYTPRNSFKNINKNKIYTMVKEREKAIKNPMQYIVQVIKTAIKRVIK